MNAASLRFVFDPVGEELAAAKECEAQVFMKTYGNTPEEFDVEYGPYENSTGFMTVLEPDGQAAAAVRFIAPGRAGLKTLNDVARSPWHVDGLQSARLAGIDPARTWDVATIAVRRGSGRDGLCAGALYYGLVRAACANNIDFFVMIVDSHVRELLGGLGVRPEILPGTTTAEYLGSPHSTPLWSSIKGGLEAQRESNPNAHRLIFQGDGLEGIAMPTDWTWRRTELRQ